jgi:diacylglycerol kinase family enzyme
MFGWGQDKAPEIRRIGMVVNTASGSVGPAAPGEAEGLLAELGIEGHIHVPADGDVIGAVKAAFETKPDLVAILAGDGTARAAAQMAGPHGQLLAPLPGGTMNMLPHALYGLRDWKTALRDSITNGEVRHVGGGDINGQNFYVAAILGSPALFAEAREAVRGGDLVLAFKRAQRAFRRVLRGRLKYSFEKGRSGKAEAITLLCPLISAALPDDEKALEAATLDVRTAADVFRLAYTAAVRDWREDPAVSVGLCKHGEVRAYGQIPAILDGEPVEFEDIARIRYHPHAFRALVPASDDPAEAAAAGVSAA